MKMRALLFLLLAAAGPALAAIDAPADAKLTPQQVDFFEKKIRPVLAEKCYSCHSEKADKIKGGLVLDTREGIRRGGDSGAAVTPGNLKESILIQAIRYADKDFAMPPEKKGGKLPDAVIKDFEEWVKMGAPDPRDGAAAVVKKHDMEAAKQWWAFQLPKQGTVPQPKDAAWARNDIDRFLLAALETKNLKPVGDADAATLLRRVTFDLTGLPPTPKEVGEFFQQCQAPGATPQAVLARWVDRLLASPQFGERWGRHWLDVARYAESSGKEMNVTFPHAWRYRDYVIASFNEDKPYDQFVREQLAGDLLPAKDDKQKSAQLVATGFLALGPKSLNEQNAKQFYLDVADEQIDTVSQAFMGMTVSCARCHDHKFDPISQREYYALAGIFLSTDTRYGTATGIQNRHSSELIDLPQGAAVSNHTLSKEDRARKEQQLDNLRKQQREFIQGIIQRRMAGKGDPEQTGLQQLRPIFIIAQIGDIETELKSFGEDGKPKPLAMGVQDMPAGRGRAIGRGIGEFLRRGPQFRLGRPTDFSSIGDSAFYTRGESDKAADAVPRGFPAILTTGSAPAIPKTESGRRELAEWVASPGNPLTSRVMVNRVWHWLFGAGLVESTDNFGASGKKPNNQALLDFLAVKFQTPKAQGGYGWSVKTLLRDLILSHAYALASDYHPANFAADPENSLLWRASKKRLDAECIRDAMLAASGQLQLDPPIGSFIARSGDANIGGPSLLSVSEQQLAASGGTEFARSVYLPIARDVPPDALGVFDFSDPNLVTGDREKTNVPAQALYILNSEFTAKAAQKLAERVMTTYPGSGTMANFDQRVAYAIWLTLGRAPTAAERTAASNFFQKFPSNWSKGDTRRPGGLKNVDEVKAAWTSFCRSLFGASDFRYLN
jgi:cytochrome c553